MKCKICGSEWQTENEVKTCPFCGRLLVEPADFTDIGQTLRFIMDTYGERIAKNPNSIVSYLGDLAPKLTSERRLIKICADAGIIVELFSITEQAEMDLAVKRAIVLLNSTYFLEKDWAEKAIGWLITSLGWSVQLQQLQPEKSDEKKAVLPSMQGSSGSTVREKLMEPSKSIHANDSEERKRLMYELCKLLHWYLDSTHLYSSSPSPQREETKNPNQNVAAPNGNVVFVVKNSFNPFALADGSTYKFKIDDALEIPIVAQKKKVTETIDLAAGPHTVSLKIYGWDDPKCSGAAIHDVGVQTFTIEPPEAAFIVAKRPGMFATMTLDIVNADQESSLAKQVKN